jgi:hypothetical protein
VDSSSTGVKLLFRDPAVVITHHEVEMGADVSAGFDSGGTDCNDLISQIEDGTFNGES